MRASTTAATSRCAGSTPRGCRSRRLRASWKRWTACSCRAASGHADGTRAQETYAEGVVHERHRHRYEVNNHYRPQLVEAGLVVSGTVYEGRLVEIVELPDHPWFVASQFHPEFKSRPTRPTPLFREFVGAALDRARERAGVAAAA